MSISHDNLDRVSNLDRYRWWGSGNLDLLRSPVSPFFFLSHRLPRPRIVESLFISVARYCCTVTFFDLTLWNTQLLPGFFVCKYEKRLWGNTSRRYRGPRPRILVPSHCHFKAGWSLLVSCAGFHFVFCCVSRLLTRLVLATDCLSSTSGVLDMFYDSQDLEAIDPTIIKSIFASYF
jgi:hypothetical protein